MTALLVLAWRELGRHRLRTALTVAGIACGVALVVAIAAINATTLAAFTDAIDDLAGTAAIQVRGTGPFDEEVADRIRAVPGVDHAVPIVTDTFFGVAPPLVGEALAVFAADVSDGHAIRTLHLVRSGEHVVDDPLSFLVDPASLVVTDALADRLGARVGTPLRLRTPVGDRTFTVRGILPPGGVGRAFGGDLVLMDVVGAQTILDRGRRIDQVDVTVRPDASADDVLARIAAVLPPGLDAQPPARRGEQIERYLRSYRTLLSGISALALLAAAFVVGSTIATAIAARRRELGLLRCVGAPRRHVVALVLAEGVLASLAGTAAGIPLGLLLGRVLVASASESAGLIFSVRTFDTPLAVTPGSLLLGLGSGVGAAVGAAWPSAWSAARLAPVIAVHAAPPAGARPWPPLRVVIATAFLATVAATVEIAAASAWSGNVAALAIDVALVLLFMRHAAGVLRVLLARPPATIGVSGRLAADRLRALPTPLALAASVLALGIGLMLMAGTLARSFEASILDFIQHQVRADLVVASTTSTGWVESPLDGTLADRLAALPGIRGVERLRLAEQRFGGERISVDSLDASAFAPARRDDFVFAAGDPDIALAAVREGRGVLVSRNFARRFGVAPGASLTLDTPTGPFTAPVVGVVVDYVSPLGSVVLGRPTYEQRWQDTRANRFHVVLAPGASVDAVRREIVDGPGQGLGLKVLTQRELYAYHRDAVARAFRFTRALEALPLVVAGLGLAEALLAVSLDRRRELALLRASGATRGQIARSVVVEAAGVGVLGWLGGLAMGMALSLLWVRINFAVQIGWDLDFHFATGLLPAAGLAALAVAIPAGLLPARRAAHLPVAEALRGE